MRRYIGLSAEGKNYDSGIGKSSQLGGEERRGGDGKQVDKGPDRELEKNHVGLELEKSESNLFCRRRKSRKGVHC